MLMLYRVGLMLAEVVQIKKIGENSEAEQKKEQLISQFQIKAISLIGASYACTNLISYRNIDRLLFLIARVICLYPRLSRGFSAVVLSGRLPCLLGNHTGFNLYVWGQYGVCQPNGRRIYRLAQINMVGATGWSGAMVSRHYFDPQPQRHHHTNPLVETDHVGRFYPLGAFIRPHQLV